MPAAELPAPRTTVAESGGAPVVVLDRVTVRFGDGGGRFRRARTAPVDALSDVSLTVREGEFAVLVGPSGCGKTTLLRVVAGFARPATGTARVHDAAPVPGQGIGVVFQQPRLFPWRTVGGNRTCAL
ncbi:MAG: ATP-binding cassette domain-containing protein, partial [Streptomycetaceae bacterium]|nr:ATP-binding cassette domain-containing protein [Streptomycetaceae bacterium]